MSEYRECTCHPDDFPPEPCAEQYALTDCLRERIALLEEAIPLLREVMEWHRDKDDSEYHGCDVDPCMWCHTASKLLQEQGNE